MRRSTCFTRQQTEFAAGVALLALAAGCAHADGFRCGNKLIVEGDTILKVAAACGNPAYVEHSSIVRSSASLWGFGRPGISQSEAEIPVEVWIYNLGPSKLMRKIRFEDGIVIRIETLEHGYNAR